MFSKDLYCRHKKNKGLFGNGLNWTKLKAFVENKFRSGENYEFFYALVSKDRGHIVLPLSVCPSVCLHKLNMKTEHVPITPKLI